MTWRGIWDGRWDGAWEGSSEPATPGEMFARLAGSGSLTGTLEGLASGGFADISAVLTGSGSLVGTLYQPQSAGGGGGGGKVVDFTPSKRLWWLHPAGKKKEKAAKKAARIIIQGVVAEVSKEEIQEAIAPFVQRAPEFDWLAFFAEARYQSLAQNIKNADRLAAILAKHQEQWEAEREEEDLWLMLA